MEQKNTSAVSVCRFLERGKDTLDLRLCAGESGLDSTIREPAVNRPGLALTGFFRYFARRRIQVFGHAEHAYIAALDDKERAERLRQMFKQNVPCVVVTRNRRPLPEMVELGDAGKTPVLRSSMITGDFMNAATILMSRLTAPKTQIQGTMVEILGVGVLITGPAGIGKSEAALALIKKGNSLVSDDVTSLRLDHGSLIASAVDATRYHVELRGLGIIHVPSLFGVASIRHEKKLDLIVKLEPVAAGAGIPRPPRGSREVLGATIPEIILPVAPGREPAALIEVAALDMKLRFLGHDAEKELDEKLIASMADGDGSE